MSVTWEVTKPEKWLSALTYLLFQVNYSLSTQVLMSYSCGSRQNGQQIIAGNILQNSALDKL